MRRSVCAVIFFCLLGTSATERADPAELRQLRDELVTEIRRGQDAEQREIYSLGRSIETAVQRLEEALERRFLALLLLVLLSFVVVILGLLFVWFRMGRLEERLFPRQRTKVLGRLGRTETPSPPR